jgi:predicted ATP-binding protein involved in virulence
MVNQNNMDAKTFYREKTHHDLKENCGVMLTGEELFTLMEEYHAQFKDSKEVKPRDDDIKKYFTSHHFDDKNGHHYRINKDRIFGAKAMRDGKITLK